MSKEKQKGTDFWSRVDRSGDCWIWLGYVDSQTGYGQVAIGDGSTKHVGAHRHAYEIANGPIPDGMFILHSCDNRRCVNPAHLRAGTAGDNAQDAVSRGRTRGARGMSNANARLTPEQIASIRSRYIEKHRKYIRGWASNADELAEEFGITKQYVGQLIRGDWRAYE